MSGYVTAAKELLGGLDKKDKLVVASLVGLLVLVGILRFRGGLGLTLSFSGILGIAILFFTYYQLRIQQSGSYPDYPHPRPDLDEDGVGPPKLGLRNFGGPALNLSVYGRITGENVHKGTIVCDSATVNLRNDEFISLAQGDFKNLFEPEFLKDHDDGVIELYYSFEAVSGRSYPRGFDRDTPIAEIADEHSSPRTVCIQEIIERRDTESA